LEGNGHGSIYLLPCQLSGTSAESHENPQLIRTEIMQIRIWGAAAPPSPTAWRRLLCVLAYTSFDMALNSPARRCIFISYKMGHMPFQGDWVFEKVPYSTDSLCFIGMVMHFWYTVI
jgi:hypothetical protein